MFEILSLAREIDHPNAKIIADLQDSVIETSLADPEAWLKMKNLLENEIENRISRQNSESLQTYENA